MPGSAAGAPPARAYETVLAWVEESILDGRLKVGDLLPSERDLAIQLGVSRPAVREAVRSLQAQGVLHSAVGAGAAGGTKVTAVASESLVRFLRLHVALAHFPAEDVVEGRIALERLSARLAVVHASEDDYARMATALRVMDETDDEAVFNDADTEFHVAIAEAAGNRLVADMTIAIRESLDLPILNAYKRLDTWRDLADTLREDHHGIYQALRAHQAEQAEDLLETHIRRAWIRLNRAPADVSEPGP